MLFTGIENKVSKIIVDSDRRQHTSRRLNLLQTFAQLWAVLEFQAFLVSSNGFFKFVCTV